MNINQGQAFIKIFYGQFGCNTNRHKLTHTLYYIYYNVLFKHIQKYKKNTYMKSSDAL